MIIPDQNKKHFSEKIIYLPNTYQVNDSTLKISEKKFSFIISCHTRIIVVLEDNLFSK